MSVSGIRWCGVSPSITQDANELTLGKSRIDSRSDSCASENNKDASVNPRDHESPIYLYMLISFSRNRLSIRELLVSKILERGRMFRKTHLDAAASLLFEQYILRLHVAVYDLVLVEGVQAEQQRMREFADELQTEALEVILLDELVQVDTE